MKVRVRVRCAYHSSKGNCSTIPHVRYSHHIEWQRHVIEMHPSKLKL